MNKYADLLQAAEPVKNLLREQYDPMCEIRITFDLSLIHIFFHTVARFPL